MRDTSPDKHRPEHTGRPFCGYPIHRRMMGCSITCQQRRLFHSVMQTQRSNRHRLQIQSHECMKAHTHKHLLSSCILETGNRDKTEPSAPARKKKTSTGGFHGNCPPFTLGGGQATCGWVTPAFKVAHDQGGREFEVVLSLNPSDFSASVMRRVIWGSLCAAQAV